uniref:Secreted protein n=1 Tax=Heterorhabditis bacteriophora TaxID=37862 RepID=A0A1I7WPD0_HETBA
MVIGVLRARWPAHSGHIIVLQPGLGASTGVDCGIVLLESELTHPGSQRCSLSSTQTSSLFLKTRRSIFSQSHFMNILAQQSLSPICSCVTCGHFFIPPMSQVLRIPLMLIVLFDAYFNSTSFALA